MNWQSIKTQVITGWNFFRIVRLLLAIVILIQAAIALSFALGILGVLLFIQALVGIGCVSGGCGFPAYRETGPPGTPPDEIVYEEVKK